ncbi:MAG: hypothetical protein ABL983_01550 [Nitrospira sp.]
MKSKFIVLLVAMTIVASEGTGWANNVCWEMMVSSLKGEHLLCKDNPDTVGDYVKNTLLFPFGLIGSATVVTISPIAMVFAPSESLETNDPEARERLREIERSNFSTLQRMNNQFQSSGASTRYSSTSGLSGRAGSRNGERNEGIDDSR